MFFVWAIQHLERIDWRELVAWPKGNVKLSTRAWRGFLLQLIQRTIAQRFRAKMSWNVVIGIGNWQYVMQAIWKGFQSSACISLASHWSQGAENIAEKNDVWIKYHLSLCLRILSFHTRLVLWFLSLYSGYSLLNSCMVFVAANRV